MCVWQAQCKGAKQTLECAFVLCNSTVSSGPCGWLRSASICCLHTCYTREGLQPSLTALSSGGCYVPAAHSLKQQARNSTRLWPPSSGSCEASGSPSPARSSDLSISTSGSPTPPRLWGRSASCPPISPPPGRESGTPPSSCPCAHRTSTTRCQRSWCPYGSHTTWTWWPRTSRIRARTVCIWTSTLQRRTVSRRGKTLSCAFTCLMLAAAVGWGPHCSVIIMSSCHRCHQRLIYHPKHHFLALPEGQKCIDVSEQWCRKTGPSFTFTWRICNFLLFYLYIFI